MGGPHRQVGQEGGLSGDQRAGGAKEGAQAIAVAAGPLRHQQLPLATRGAGTEADPVAQTVAVEIDLHRRRHHRRRPQPRTGAQPQYGAFRAPSQRQRVLAQYGNEFQAPSQRQRVLAQGAVDQQVAVVQRHGQGQGVRGAAFRQNLQAQGGLVCAGVDRPHAALIHQGSGAIGGNADHSQAVVAAAEHHHAVRQGDATAEAAQRQSPGGQRRQAGGLHLHAGEAVGASVADQQLQRSRAAAAGQGHAEIGGFAGGSDQLTAIQAGEGRVAVGRGQQRGCAAADVDQG